jgi:hypothetical protein
MGISAQSFGAAEQFRAAFAQLGTERDFYPHSLAANEDNGLCLCFTYIKSSFVYENLEIIGNSWLRRAAIRPGLQVTG